MPNPIIQSYLNDPSIDLGKRQNLLKALNAGTADEADVASKIQLKYNNKYGGGSTNGDPHDSIPSPMDVPQVADFLKGRSGKWAMSHSNYAESHPESGMKPLTDEQKVQVQQSASGDFDPQKMPLDKLKSIVSQQQSQGKGTTKEMMALLSRQDPVNAAVRGTVEGINAGGTQVGQGVGKIGEAVNPFSNMSAEDRVLKGTGGVMDTIQGGLNAAFAAPGAVINEVPVAKDVVGFGMEKLNEGSKYAGDTFMQHMGIDPESEQGKIVSQGFNVLGNLLAVKVGKDVGGELGKRAGIEKATKAGDMGTAFELSAQKPTLTGKLGADVVEGVGDLAGKVAEKTGELAKNSLKNMGESRIQRVIDGRVKELTKLQENNAQLRKVISNAESKGIDVKSDLAKTDLLRDAVDTDGTIKTDIAIDKLNEFIRPQENVIGQNLRREGKMINLADVEAKMKADIKASGVKGGALVRALKNVESDIKGYKLEANAKGEVPIATLHDAKVDKYANIDYLNPETSRVDKTIAKSLKKIVEENAQIDVKGLNAELSKYYAMQNLLEKLNGKKVAGGRLGKYFAQGVGGLAGSTIGSIGGPLGGFAGTIAGAEVGNALKGFQMSKKFSGKTGYELTPSDAMKQAIETGKDQPSILGTRITSQTINKATPSIQESTVGINGESNMQPTAKINQNQDFSQNSIGENVKVGGKSKPTASKKSSGIPVEFEPLAEIARKYKNASQFKNKLEDIVAQYKAGIELMPQYKAVIDIIKSNPNIGTPTEFWNRAMKSSSKKILVKK